MSTRIDVTPLFATPVAATELPDAAALNRELRAAIAARERSHPGEQHSNLGGWQSSWDMEAWGGAPAARLLAAARAIADRITVDRAGRPVSIAWRANMWANVNRAGHGNEFHAHPGSFWSAGRVMRPTTRGRSCPVTGMGCLPSTRTASRSRARPSASPPHAIRGGSPRT